jgi:hypothetical protein
VIFPLILSIRIDFPGYRYSLQSIKINTQPWQRLRSPRLCSLSNGDVYWVYCLLKFLKHGWNLHPSCQQGHKEYRFGFQWITKD